ncbi:MAG: bifunctional lysine ketoglutarate reductase /saccharopine dehydrogenase family protein [bacterium]
MGKTIGIRREDKNEWERRVPLIPTDLKNLQQQHAIEFRVQPSPIRVFTDDEYRDAGIDVNEDLAAADLVIAVKEIPTDLLRAGKSYLYFSHVIKGQDYNMAMLQRLLDLGCSLVDYEKIADEKNRRLIFFSLHAGYAGMIESLWCLGQRLLARGITTPLAEVKHAYEYSDLAAAKAHLGELGERITTEGLPAEFQPLVFGVAGYGNVAQGCQDLLDCLPVTEIGVAELPTETARTANSGSALLKVVFKEEDIVEPVAPNDQFELQDYYQHPEKYRGKFAQHLPYLDVLMNTIYWDERYPRLVTKEWARENYSTDRQARLQVIGDISCDYEGSIQLTIKPTYPDAPCYVYDPASDTIADGVEGVGPVIMAVDNLPCELPRESSEHFSTVLRDMVPGLAGADWQADFAALDLPDFLKKAVIVHKGQLTPDYRYLQEFLPS